ncbi:MAG: DUF3788 domain-containing protein [Clostridia bacterium]|jgi:hypothetical protein|nr:DUF3788 domain-containing protein [Clostridia bacterium]MBT7122350.1 DUF3788 domain-containing protein [Clostridia bacterium]
MNYERMLDKEVTPSESDIVENIGERAQLWKRIHEYMAASCDFERELKFYAKKYGWTVRYRKSGRTLCSFFPEAGAFSALIVLGSKEAAKVESVKEKLNANVRSVFVQTEQLRDGKWMWIRVLEESDVESIKMLLGAKRKPKCT